MNRAIPEFCFLVISVGDLLSERWATSWSAEKCQMDHVKELMFQPMPELLMMAFHRERLEEEPLLNRLSFPKTPYPHTPPQPSLQAVERRKLTELISMYLRSLFLFQTDRWSRISPSPANMTMDMKGNVKDVPMSAEMDMHKPVQVNTPPSSTVDMHVSGGMDVPMRVCAEFVDYTLEVGFCCFVVVVVFLLLYGR